MTNTAPRLKGLVNMIPWHKRYGNSEPVCPYCGHVYTDAWDLNLEQDEEMILECGECEKEFHVQCCIDITYHTRTEGQSYGWDTEEEDDASQPTT